MKVGSKVVCIRELDTWHIYSRICPSRPKVGNIYTVREVVELNDYTGLRFYELNNPNHTFDIGTVEVALTQSASVK